MSFSAVLHILYQAVLNFPVIAGVLIALPILAILYVSFARFRNWKRGKTPALVLAFIAGVVAFFGLPVLFRSNLSYISYLVDWLFHMTSVILIMMYVYLMVWFFMTPSREITNQ